MISRVCSSSMVHVCCPFFASPKPMHPIQMRDTFNSEFPNLAYLIMNSPLNNDVHGRDFQKRLLSRVLNLLLRFRLRSLHNLRSSRLEGSLSRRRSTRISRYAPVLFLF